MGKANPLIKNKNELKKAQNRRVEFSLEYHVYAIEESNKLRKLYREALIDKNLDHSYLKNSITKLLYDNSNFEKIEPEKLHDKFNANIILENNIKIDSLFKKNKVDENINLEEESLKIADENINKEEIVNEITQSKYILVTAVLSNESNALNYINKNPVFKYELIDGKYYIYEKSDVSKENLLQIKYSYKKDSWIKKVR